ncbi:MAG: hypothetical protein RLZZ517_98 [Candidatus Parcubacteria bacterium]|jgi:O-antigen ligase/tetratricopeptide (TPR) repeat protein
MTKHNIWNVSIIGLLFALLFTPLIVASGFYFPYVTGKVFTFRIITTLIFIGWTILVLKKPEYMPKKSLVLLFSGVFVLWLGFVNIFSVDSFNSFFSNFERMEGWFTHVYLFIYVLVLSSVVKSDKVWIWILSISVIVANIIGLKAAFDSVSRTQVILGNSTYVAIYILFNLFFVFFLLFRLINLKTKEEAVKILGILYYVLSIILFIYVIFKTQTRGTVLALVFSSLIFCILTAISYWNSKKVRFISILLLVLGIGGSVLFWTNRDSVFIQNNPLLVRIATISLSEGTGKARLINWGIALEGIKEKPIVGWGQENYSYVFAQKYDPRMYGQEPWFDRTHNAFLDWTVQSGIVGGLLYITLFMCALWTIYKSNSLVKTEKNILISLIIAYGIHNFFVFDNYSSYLMFFTTLGLIVFYDDKEIFVCRKNEKVKQAAVGVVIILLVLVSVFTIVKPIIVARNLIQVFSEKDISKALAMYETIENKKTFGTTEAGIRLMADIGRYAQTEDQKNLQKYVQLVNKFGDQFINSGDVRRMEAYGTFLLQIGDIKKSIEVLEKAKNLAPDRQNNLYVLGIAYISNQQMDKAIETFEHAYKVLPENDKARTYYGAVLYVAGKPEGKELMKGYSYKDTFFLTIFSRGKRYDEVIKIRELLAKDNPTDYQGKINLAVAYYLNKQPAKAIVIIKEVQKAVPQFVEQGNYLIKEIQAGRSIVK